MKKICITLLFIAILGVSVLSGCSVNGSQSDYLRLHIRANSNQFVDQNIKYQVKDIVTEYLTPKVCLCTTKQQSLDMIKKEISGLNRLIDGFLLQNGFEYGAKVSLRQEYFPTRCYSSQTLEAGVYDALIIELGSGTGDNWWCVVYPPLCFTGSQNVEYRSIIYDVIKKFKE